MIIRTASCLIFLMLATPVAAQDNTTSQLLDNLTEKSDEELLAILRDGGRRWMEEPCDFGVPLFSQLAERRPNSASHARGALLSEAFCADIQGNYARGIEKVRQLREVFPEDDFSYLGLYFVGRLEDADGALEELKRLKDEQLEQLEPDEFWSLFRTIRKAGKVDSIEDLALEWSDTRKLSLVSGELQPGLAKLAITAAIRKGRGNGVGELLSYIRSPASYIDMLADRQFEASWPLIEPAAGPNLSKAAESEVEWALARLDTAPEDSSRLSDVARALHYAGRFDEVVELVSPVFEANPTLAGLEEDEGWALNLLAYAYDSLGERAKADAVFDALARLDPDENYWVVNFVINRSSRLIGQQRWEAGMEAAALARTVTNDNGTKYAKVILARDHACVLPMVGREDERIAEFEFLRANAIESPFLVASGLMCGGLEEEAAQVLIDGLNDPATRGPLLSDLQPGDFDLFYTPSSLPSPRDLLESHQPLRDTFDRYARIIPASFVPEAALNRRRLLE